MGKDRSDCKEVLNASLENPSNEEHAEHAHAHDPVCGGVELEEMYAISGCASHLIHLPSSNSARAALAAKQFSVGCCL